MGLKVANFLIARRSARQCYDDALTLYQNTWLGKGMSFCRVTWQSFIGWQVKAASSSEIPNFTACNPTHASVMNGDDIAEWSTIFEIVAFAFLVICLCFPSSPKVSQCHRSGIAEFMNHERLRFCHVSVVVGHCLNTWLLSSSAFRHRGQELSEATLLSLKFFRVGIKFLERRQIMMNVLLARLENRHVLLPLEEFAESFVQYFLERCCRYFYQCRRLESNDYSKQKFGLIFQLTNINHLAVIFLLPKHFSR
ncbi:hypothetical protein J1N35_035531 [Gossypium stocksii]|uniref:Uncharacterized protein n=1 Tax=Gossypium stocksii TaxID=47602 RepID=A0A9D3UU35_9ROSI|nr:hypothetical protein J1N35_035531 [Gossypium stocksii]